jgi:hypothetical protein
MGVDQEVVAPKVNGAPMQPVNISGPKLGQNMGSASPAQ